MRKLHEMYLSIAVWLQVCSASVKRVTAALLMLLVSQQAFAQQISDFASNWQDEASKIVPVVLLIVAAIGIIIAGTAIISPDFS